jgi:gluconolactonase
VGSVVVVSPSGKQLGTIRLPQTPGIATTTTNVAFGDADRRTLYIAARTHLYRIRVNVPGPPPVLAALVVLLKWTAGTDDAQ